MKKRKFETAPISKDEHIRRCKEFLSACSIDHPEHAKVKKMLDNVREPVELIDE